MKEKLQNPSILSFLLNFDIVWILETKYFSQSSVPGFRVYLNESKKGRHRGGVIMLVKCALVDYITRVDTDDEGMIWLELSMCVGIKLGGVYIPPADSLYFDMSLFGLLQARCADSEKCIILGDFNARVGVPSIEVGGVNMQYSNVKDMTVNSHGRVIQNICNENEMVIVNHLKTNDTVYGGDLSFRSGNRWVSEIDLCIVKVGCIPLIKNINVNQTVIGSDHAPLCVTIDISATNTMTAGMLMERSNCLGKVYQNQMKPKVLMKTPRYSVVDHQEFANAMEALSPPVVANYTDIGNALSESLDAIDKVARQCHKREQPTGVAGDIQPRWKALLESNDHKKIWKAINWRGNIDSSSEVQPDDEQFRVHFEKLLNPPQREVTEDDELPSPIIPILDDPFNMQELHTAMSSMNKNKSYIGICPGLIGILPITWLIFLLTVFNVIFTCVSYPLLWCYNKLIVLYKSGERLNCGNYRGISIMNTLAKLYDTLLLNRLTMWANVDKCQAGSQKGRGCIEQIMTLRMLCDYAKYKKVKLYVMFIDFSKAYDRVPRDKLVNVLKLLGCGRNMVRAIKAMYTCTKNVLNSAIVSATIGVRQGSPSSCLLFTIYVDQMVRKLKLEIGEDGFLSNLHALLLMDDTVLVSTSRDMCAKKLNVVLDYCDEYGMAINSKKTKFFVIGGAREDSRPFITRGHEITFSDKYMYLGAWFTADARIESVLRLHEASGDATVNKFALFCAANTDMPFVYKRKVFEAAVMSSLLYSCETWFSKYPKIAVKQYNKAVRCLLGVRHNTSIELCLVESGIHPLKFIILKKLNTFLKSKLREPDPEEPFNIVYRLCQQVNTPGYRFLLNALEVNVNANPLNEIVSSIRNKPVEATKFETYRTQFNPLLAVHPLYKESIFIEDHKRQAFSRLRLMSHSLRIETGRWSRTPPERRLCSCNNNEVQSEKHVMLDCVLVDHLRTRYHMLNFTSLDQLLGTDKWFELCDYIYYVLNCIG